eukprot:GHVU01049753.1.p1 GENE.GHVU01049753.1~~GHVU01049753.1.p1  ORF type:complete len:254 (+),score=38.37 GHVU01049753.1:67-828(+)
MALPLLTLPKRGSTLNFESQGYIVEAPVKPGAFAKTYIVTDHRDQTSWLAKVVDLGVLDERDKEYCIQEARLLKKLNHPNVVRMRESFTYEGCLVTIQEHCILGDLSESIMNLKAENRLLRQSELLRILVQVLEGLRYLHSERITHRDLKPGNLFVSEGGTIKIGDFGVSRETSKTLSLLRTMMVGTPGYMAPEVSSSASYTNKADVWALGCIAYELATLSLPGSHLNDPNKLAEAFQRLPVELDQVSGSVSQ